MDDKELLTRLEMAERVCLMVGWTASDPSERGKALHELWSEWTRAYRAAGGSLSPRAHPDLSDDRIRELAARRDETVRRTLAGFANR